MADAEGGGALAVSQRNGEVFAVRRRVPGFPACGASIVVLSARTGAVVRRIPVSGDPGLPVVDDRVSRLYVPAFRPGRRPGQGALTVVETRTLRLVATRQLGGIPDAVVAAGNAGRVLVRTFDPACSSCRPVLHLVDAATGAEMRSIPSAASGRFAVDEERGRIYMTAGSVLTALDARSGKTEWTRDVHPCGWGLAFVQRSGRLFTTTGGSVGRGGSGSHGHFCVIDPATRWAVRSADEGEGILLQLLAVDGPAGVVLAVVRGPRGDGAVELLDAVDGRVKRRVTGLEEARAAAVDSRTGHMYVLSRVMAGGDALFDLDPHGWAVTELGRSLNASSLSLAERTGHVFLANPARGRVTVVCSRRGC